MPAIAAGDAVSPYYDAMLAKVIAWAPTRDLAIERLNRGLEETDVRGIVTNIPFLSALITQPDVRANTIDTSFIERELKKLTPEAPVSPISSCARPWSRSSANEAAAPARRRTRRGGTAGWMPVGRRRHRRFPFRQAEGGEHKVSLRLWQRSVDAVDRRARTGLRQFRPRRHGSSSSGCTASKSQVSP